MTTSLELYKSVLRELDKFESPSFTLEDFNYFFNAAADNVIETMAVKMEVSDEAYMHVKSLIKDIPLSELGDNEFEDITEDVVRLCGYKVKCDGKEHMAVYMPPSRRSYIMYNYFSRPDKDQVYYENSNGRVLFLLGNGNIVESASAVVVTHPDRVVISSDTTLVKDSTLPRKTNREIVREATRLFLENTQNVRYQTQITEDQLRTSKK